MGEQSPERVSTPSGAVFLSYASEDAEAAQRICEALRSSGIEVWFDQRELRGGDAWDRQIRKQIHDCVLFVPIISAHSDARREGYFRREWRLAVERAGDIAEDVPFLLPVVIDSTPDTTARVPDRFRDVQWSRLKDGQPSPAFIERVQRLLSPAPDHAPTAHLTTLSVSNATPRARRPVRGPSWSRLALLVTVAGVLLVALAYFIADRLWISKHLTVTSAPSITAGPANAPPFTPPPHSIAVLPFVNTSSDKENEYFSDGVTEELISALSRVSGLHVAAQTSSFAFKGRNEDIRTIGMKLDVGAVLEGSVSKEGHRVRIAAQLVDTKNGYQLWSDTYDRELKDIFEIRTQLAQTVISALQVKLLAGELQTLERKPTEDIEAYNLYLKARHSIAAYTSDGLSAGLRDLQQAIARDPGYARAYIGLAYYYIIMLDFIPGKDALARGRAAAEKALELDATQAEAHADLGWILWMEDYDHQGARREFRTALEMQPRLAWTHVMYGWYLICVGDTEAGLAESRQAVELDPLSAEANTILGFNLMFARRYDEAIRQLRIAVAVDPDFFWSHEYLGRTLAQKHQWAEALAELRTARAITGAFTPEIDSELGRIYADSGDRAAAVKVLSQLEEQRRASFFPAYEVAIVHAGLGQTDEALRLLEDAYAERGLWMSWLGVDPDLDQLRSDPRFKALLRKVGLLH